MRMWGKKATRMTILASFALLLLAVLLYTTSHIWGRALGLASVLIFTMGRESPRIQQVDSRRLVIIYYIGHGIAFACLLFGAILSNSFFLTAAILISVASSTIALLNQPVN